MIDCIANSDMTKGPEVPLWECPCRECTHMEWKVVCENSESIYEKPPTLKAWRHDKWGGFWDAQGKAIALFRCLCGCKYWENYLCVDCGEHQSKADS